MRVARMGPEFHLPWVDDAGRQLRDGEFLKRRPSCGLGTVFQIRPQQCSVRLQLVEWEADAEAGVAGLGADADVAAMLADDAHGVVETQA